MEHEDYIKKRDDVLGWKDRAWEEWHVASKGLDWSDSTNVQEVATEIRKRHQLEAAQAIDALVLEVIGKNNKYNDTYEPDPKKADFKVWQNEIYLHRNELRYEQRRIVQGDKS